MLENIGDLKMSVCAGDEIAVWFSCGAASAVAAKKTLEKYGDICTVRVVNNPVAEEHPDNQRFLRDVEKWLGTEIETAINPKFPSCSAVDVWAQRKYMGGIAGAPCTLELKKAARQHWEASNPVDWTVLGFTADEQERSDRFQKTERFVLPVLIEARITKKDCFRILFAAGIEIPEIYKLGYPNANCIGCVKGGLGYWRAIREDFPTQFERVAQAEDKVADLHGENAYILRHRSGPLAGKRFRLRELPAGKADRAEPLPSCGLFCEMAEKEYAS